MYHEKYLFCNKILTFLTPMLAAALVISTPAHAQYLMAESLEEELLCRVAIRACLKPVACPASKQSQDKFCWDNQCSFKPHLTVGVQKETSLLKVGDILTSSVRDPFLADVYGPVMGSQVLDCKQPSSAKAIVASQRPQFPKTVPSPATELSVKR